VPSKKIKQKKAAVISAEDPRPDASMQAKVKNPAHAMYSAKTSHH